MIINERTFDPKVYRSVTTKSYRRSLKPLSDQVKDIVQSKYDQWLLDGALNFEPKFANYFVVEVMRKIHAICKVDGTDIVWLWIGKYDDYSNYMSSLRKGGNSN